MTPHQIDSIITICLKENSINQNLNLIAPIVITIISVLLIAYLKKKGDNFANKEDLKKLTTITETVKAEFTEKIERLRIKLDTISFKSKFQYEKTYELYTKLWSQYTKLHKQFRQIDLLFTQDKSEKFHKVAKKTKTPYNLKQSIDNSIAETMKVFASINEEKIKNQPFYSKDILLKLKEIEEYCYNLLMHKEDENFNEIISEGNKEIQNKMDNLSKMINHELELRDS